MRVWNVKREWKRPFFVHCRKHNCPACGGELDTVKESRIVHASAEEAKDFDFSFAGGEGGMFGRVKFIWTEFRCPRCRKNYAIDEIYQFERKERAAHDLSSNRTGI